MTKLLTTSLPEVDELQELLIKNLPSTSKAGNEKHLSNIYEYKTIRALSNCKFINFNTKERISWMVFDIDEMEGKKALDYFQGIERFLDFIIEKIGLEPTYILETQKGFHFAYHLKNHVYTHQKKALSYLQAIKLAIGETLGCDPKASNRLNGVWRNPLLHNHYYSYQVNYELKDFKNLLPKRQRHQKRANKTVKIDESTLTVGNRNDALFRYAMRFAKAHSSLTVDTIFEFLENANELSEEPLPDSELLTIAHSVHRYWKAGTIKFGIIKERNINEGAMNLPKISGLSYEEYVQEVKIRQRLSAKRTNEIKDREKAKRQLAHAREQSALKRKSKNEEKIFQAVTQLQQEGLKVTISAISKVAGLDRKTVKIIMDSGTIQLKKSKIGKSNFKLKTDNFKFFKSF